VNYRRLPAGRDMAEILADCKVGGEPIPVGKLADYFRAPSVAHYLIVHLTRRTVTHHRRADAGINTRIIVSGPITLTPPGIVITVEAIYGA
jgi:hypothetical protein